MAGGVVKRLVGGFFSRRNLSMAYGWLLMISVARAMEIFQVFLPILVALMYTR